MDDKWIFDNWKQFGTDLGLDQQDIDNIEIASNRNAKIIIFDAIKTLKEKKQDDWGSNQRLSSENLMPSRLGYHDRRTYSMNMRYLRKLAERECASI